MPRTGQIPEPSICGCSSSVRNSLAVDPWQHLTSYERMQKKLQANRGKAGKAHATRLQADAGLKGCGEIRMHAHAQIGLLGTRSEDSDRIKEEPETVECDEI
jgi:hypothetical protein